MSARERNVVRPGSWKVILQKGDKAQIDNSNRFPHAW